jgi:anthranilate phosphoribosyltransferase
MGEALLMDMPSVIRALIERRDLSEAEMEQAMRTIMTGGATPAQIGGFLIGLRMKGETVEEIAAAARVMRELATVVPVARPHLVDTCGTGGDGVHTYNISTTAAFVAAAAGARVAKHGNRSVSSKSGSADVLEAAGVNLDLSPQQVAQCIDQVGVGFMFAPRHHGAMRHAIGPRREMGVRTVFNLLGPVTNPAGAPNQVVGVFSRDWVEPIARVLAKLGSEHVLVVHADDGLDEISIGSSTQVAELRQGAIQSYAIVPEQFGLVRGNVAELAVDSVTDSLAMMRAVLEDTPGPARDVALLNAAAAIYAAGVADSLEEGVARARAALSAGAARARLEALVEFSRSF